MYTNKCSRVWLKIIDDKFLQVSVLVENQAGEDSSLLHSPPSSRQTSPTHRALMVGFFFVPIVIYSTSVSLLHCLTIDDVRINEKCNSLYSKWSWSGTSATSVIYSGNLPCENLNFQRLIKNNQIEVAGKNSIDWSWKGSQIWHTNGLLWKKPNSK